MRNTFTKKVISISLCFTLVLMMIPNYLFIDKAHAANPPEANPQYEDINNFESSFGNFAYNVQDASVNKSIYSQDDILSKIGCKQLTQDEAVRQMEAAIKAALVDNHYAIRGSEAEKKLPAPEKGAVYSPTTVTSIESAQTCLSSSNVPGTTNWQFVASDPGRAKVNDSLSINSEFATWKADYLVAFDSLTLTQPVMHDFDYASAKGTIKLTPTDKVNAQKQALTLLTVDVHYKAMASTSVNYGVTVTKTSGNKDLQTNNSSNNAFTADAERSAVAGQTEIIPVPLSELTKGQPLTFKSVTPESEKYIRANISEDKTNIMLSGFHYKDNGVNVTVKFTDANGGEVPKVIHVSISKVEVTLELGEKVFDMRTSTDQLEIVKSELNNKDFKETEGEDLYTVTVAQDNFWDGNYVDLWGGSGFQEQGLKASCFSIVKKDDRSMPKTDFDFKGFDRDITIKDPENLNIEDSGLTFYDGNNIKSIDEAFVNTTVYATKKDGSKLCNKSNTSSFNEKISVEKIAVKGERFLFDFQLIAQNNGTSADSRIIKKIDSLGTDSKIIILNNDTYQGFTVEPAKSSAIEDKDFAQIIRDFFYAEEDVKINFMFKDKNIKKIVVYQEGSKDPVIEAKDPIEKQGNYVITYVTKNFEYINTAKCSLYYFYSTDEAAKPKNPNNPIGMKKLGDEYDEIISKGSAPDKVTAVWSPASPDTATYDRYTQGNQTLTISFIMPKGQESYFKYTKKIKEAKGDEANQLVTIDIKTNPVSIVKTEYIKYSDFSDEGHPGIWQATYTTDISSNVEATFNVHLKEPVDLLGRTCTSKDADAIKGEKDWEFSVDKRCPTIEDVWSGPTPVNTYPIDGVNRDFYNEPRKLALTIDEMNFEPTDFKVKIFYSDENHSQFTEQDLRNYIVWDWHLTGDYLHTIDLVFPNQGDYYVQVNGHDKALNQMNEYVSNIFTQDWTAPVMNVTWDNDSVINGKYYNAARTATITVEERNFCADKEYININPIVTAGHDGTMGNYQIGNWSEQGNIHTITVSFPVEGTYSMTIDCQDLAKNAIDNNPYSQSEFVIDWTKPNIQITGVENRQGYKESAQPIVTINDANMAPSTTCNVSNIGITKGNPYQTSPSTSDAQYTYSFSDPEKIPDNDGVYRIEVNAVDMAGNTNTESIVWSVNRFGSTYVIDSETDPMMNGYVNDETKKDVKVTEINPTGLATCSVDMTKGYVTSKLEENKDFTTNSTGGGDSWFERQYTIGKDFFKEDGRYKINFSSTDMVGNVNENTKDKSNPERNSKVNVQFMLDNTKPTCYFNNLSEDQYGDVQHECDVVFEDNSNEFTNAKVSVDGDENYVDGKELSNNENTMSLTLKESNTPHTLKVDCIDKAGNEMQTVEKTVLVSSNPFVRWFYNTPLFIGTIVVLLLVIGGITAYVIHRKKNTKI